MQLSHYISKKENKLFLILGAFFITNALVAEFVGVKIFQLESTLGLDIINIRLFGEDNSLQYTAGVLLWPVVFLMTDIINEYFGKKGVRFLSYLAVGMIIYAFLMIYGAISLAPASWWNNSFTNKGVPNAQAAYEAIFGQGLFIIIGSVLAFIVGQILDVHIFQAIRAKTGEGKIWLRATGSTLVSQLIDSFIVLGVAFYIGPSLFPESAGKPWTLQQLLSVGSNNYIYKFIVAIALTPLLYVAHHYIDRYLGKPKAEELKTMAAES